MISAKASAASFFQPDAELRLPIYLSPDIQRYLTERAAQKGVPPGEMVNTLLKQKIQMIESVRQEKPLVALNDVRN